MVISGVEAKAESAGLIDEEVVLRRSKFVELRKGLSDKEILMRQKSRIQWLKERDLNTSFFHASLAIRRSRNQMMVIMGDNIWVKEPKQIQSEVIKHF